MDKKPSKIKWIILLIISALVCIACVVVLLRFFFFGAVPTVEETLPEATTAASVATVPQATQRFLETTSLPPKAGAVDFDELMKVNPDIYAWLYIPGTKVDYPVAQSNKEEDDSFYLSHNVYKNYQFSGTIYSEKQNARNFSDPVTVLYGHNMLNGSMFATLHYFSDEDFFKKHNTLFVFTKNRLLTYLVYSAYMYDDRHILNSFEFNNKDQFREYLDSSLDPRTYEGNVRNNIELNTDDRIITLSTCPNGGGNQRYLVQGVLVNDQPRE